MKKKCPECGKEFICNHSTSCWCNSEKISAKTLKLLKEKYSDCLCKECLEKIIKSNTI